MMPTLAGRWQTRLMLFFLIGAPVALLVGWASADWLGLAPEPLLLQLSMLVVGLALDPVYQQLQRLRWDQDWPFALFALGLGLEFAIALSVLRADWLPGIDACNLARIDRETRTLTCVVDAFPLGAAMGQFAAVALLWLGCVLGALPVLFPLWRFDGGAFGGLPRPDE